MKIGNILSLVGLVIILSFSTLALANPHLCPSGKGIQNAIQDKKLVQLDGDRWGSNSTLEYFGSFDTNETWYFTISVWDARDATEAFQRFQWWFSMIPDTPQYAEDFTFTWECYYDIGITDLRYGYNVHAVLKSPGGSANIHTCPSPMEIQKRITDKSVLNRHSTPGFNTHYDTAILNVFDSYDTTETWMFHFEVNFLVKSDDAWNIFQTYMNDLPNLTQIAHEEGPVWKCSYSSPIDGVETYRVYAILKKP